MDTGNDLQPLSVPETSCGSEQLIDLTTSSAQGTSDPETSPTDTSNTSQSTDSGEPSRHPPTSSAVSVFQCLYCRKTFKRKGGLTTHMRRHFVDQKGYKKPTRPCPFCDLKQTKVARHIAKRHATHSEVINVLKLPKGSAERIQAFAKFRKEGIHKHNLKQARLKRPSFLCERRNKSIDLVMCANCKGYYGRKSFFRHKKFCIGGELNNLSPKRLQQNSDTDREGLSKKPTRPCPFCDIKQTKVKRHIARRHATHPEVINVLKLPKGSAERIQAFAKFRKEGIHKHNLKQAALKSPTFLCEKRSQSTGLIMCVKCKGYYGRSTFNRHDKSCNGEDGNTVSLGRYLNNSDRDQKSVKKPTRPCPFCSLGQTKIKRHIERRHSTLPEVANVLRLPKGSAERTRAFDKFRKEGILKHNMRQAGLMCPRFICERRNRCADLVMCVKCKGFYGRKSFYKHKKSCSGVDGNDYSPDRGKLAESQRKRRGKGSREVTSGHNTTSTMRFRWNTSSTEKIRSDFEEWICLPKGNRLPSKITLLEYMGDNPIGCTYQQLRTKIMNEQNKHQANTRDSVKKWQGFYKRSRYFGHKKFCKRGHWTNFRLDGGNVRRSLRKRRVEDTNVEDDSETELTTRKSRRIGETREEELSAEATRVPVNTERRTTSRFKWNASLTEKIRRDFAEWICLPDGNHLPSKITLLEYMGDNPIGCTYHQLRTKIMNEQNKHQADISETEETIPTVSDKIRRSGRKRLVEEGRKEESLETELTPTVRFKWDAKSTEKIKCDFAEWIGLPEGNRLPSKTALLQYMDDNPIGCRYQQLRTKIMNEQNKHQADSRNHGDKGR